MKSVQQVSNCKKQSLYLLFVHLTAAFDHIPRKCLFDSIKLHFPEGENGKLFNILGKAHPCSICMLSSLCVFSWINIRKMTLFEFLNISTTAQWEINIQIAKIENVKLWGFSTGPWCSYVNDLILFILGIHVLQKAATILDEIFPNYDFVSMY